MTDVQLALIAELTSIFAKFSPAHKERIICALEADEHATCPSRTGPLSFKMDQFWGATREQMQAIRDITLKSLQP